MRANREFRIKVRVTGKKQEVEVAHSMKFGSDEERAFAAKVSYYLSHWKDLGRPDPRTLVHFDAQADGAELHGFDTSLFRDHPELLDGIAVNVTTDLVSTLLQLPFREVDILKMIETENPGFLCALHQELVNARELWRLRPLSREKAKTLEEAISQTATVLPRL